MGTEEGERMIYKVAKQRARSRKDTGEVNVVKRVVFQQPTINVENAREQ